MHFIITPSLCLYLIRPMSSPLTLSSSLLFHPHRLCSILYLNFCFRCSFTLFFFFFLDFQSCLICVARRVPTKERPMLPTHESFTTRQDLQGTRILTDSSYKLVHRNFYLHLLYNTHLNTLGCMKNSTFLIPGASHSTSL